MAATPGTTTLTKAFTANGTVTFALGRGRLNGSLQVVLSNTGGSNFTGGTITVALSNDGVTADPAAGTAVFTIGTDTSGNLKFWTGKVASYLIVTAASLTGGSGTPTATASIVAY